MDNIALVQIFDRAAGLDHKAADLGHGEVLALLDGVGQGAILAQLEDHIGAGVKGEGAVELDDVGMGEL